MSIQRRIKLSSGGGIEMYRMEAFGLPYVELCDETFTGRDFYERIAKRACPYLNVPVRYIQTYLNDLFCNFHPNFYSTQGSDANSTSQRSTPYVFNSSSTARDGSLPPPPPAGIVPVSTEAVFAGPLPKYGFVIRTVVGGGGEGGGQVCSRCLWTKGCRGCLVPDDGTLLIDAITDEEVLAVDWHYIVYEEFIDTAVASDVRQHESVSSEEARAQTSVVPFQKCLEKFTEEEKIDGIVCPKCKKDDSMKKAINLWRGPPFLLVQLKRFQFDRFIKRKLVDKVNFPLEDFDISPYYAASRMQAPDAKLLCSQYDLYAIVHHVGRMGEGHYVSTVLLPLNDDATNGASEWVCFNDNAVSVMDVSEITAAPTAYVLLYVRKDVKGKAIEDLITTSKLPSQEGSTTASTATRASITNPRTSTGAATLPAAPPARVSMPAPRRPSAQQSSPAKEVKETARSRDSQSTEAHSDEEREAKKKPQSVETTQKQVIPSQDADVKPEKKSEQSKQTQRQPQRPQQTKKNNKGGCSLQ